MLHSCGRSDGPGITNPWLAKYIFPGGYIPALSEVLPAIERTGFLVTDIEILRLHYADTLKEWHERFLAKRGEVSYLYDERFCRMWELYLVSSEMTFREEGNGFSDSNDENARGGAEHPQLYSRRRGPPARQEGEPSYR